MEFAEVVFHVTDPDIIPIRYCGHINEVYLDPLEKTRRNNWFEGTFAFA